MINVRAMIPTYAAEMTAAVLLGALIITNNCYCFVVIIYVVHFIKLYQYILFLMR